MAGKKKPTTREQLDAARIGLDMKLKLCACSAFATRFTAWTWTETTPTPKTSTLAFGLSPAFEVTCDNCEPIKPVASAPMHHLHEGALTQAKIARRLNAIAWGDEST